MADGIIGGVEITRFNTERHYSGTRESLIAARVVTAEQWTAWETVRGAGRRGLWQRDALGQAFWISPTRRGNEHTVTVRHFGASGTARQGLYSMMHIAGNSPDAQKRHQVRVEKALEAARSDRQLQGFLSAALAGDTETPAAG